MGSGSMAAGSLLPETDPYAESHRRRPNEYPKEESANENDGVLNLGRHSLGPLGGPKMAAMTSRSASARISPVVMSWSSSDSGRSIGWPSPASTSSPAGGRVGI